VLDGVKTFQLLSNRTAGGIDDRVSRAVVERSIAQHGHQNGSDSKMSTSV
jgi:hypothetical protein